MPNSEVDLYTALFVVGTADSVLIREVPLIQSVLYREVPLHRASQFCDKPRTVNGRDGLASQANSYKKLITSFTNTSTGNDLLVLTWLC